MEVQIRPQTISQIDDLVAQGAYPSQSAVIDEAIDVGVNFLRRRRELMASTGGSERGDELAEELDEEPLPASVERVLLADESQLSAEEKQQRSAFITMIEQRKRDLAAGKGVLIPADKFRAYIERIAEHGLHPAIEPKAACK